MLDVAMERYRFADEYQGPSEFSKKVQTVAFNHNDDHINGIFELPEDGEFDEDCLEENAPFDVSMV